MVLRIFCCHPWVWRLCFQTCVWISAVLALKLLFSRLATP